MDKTRKNEPFWFDGGPLPLKLCYCITPKAWKIALKQMELDPKVEPFPSETAGRCVTFKGTKFPELVAVIVVNKRPGISDSQIAGLIAHEATHVAQYLAKSMFPYDETARLDHETEAYLVHWATQNIYAAYLEHGQ